MPRYRWSCTHYFLDDWDLGRLFNSTNSTWDTMDEDWQIFQSACPKYRRRSRTDATFILKPCREAKRRRAVQMIFLDSLSWVARCEPKNRLWMEHYSSAQDSNGCIKRAIDKECLRRNESIKFAHQRLDPRQYCFAIDVCNADEYSEYKYSDDLLRRRLPRAGIITKTSAP